MLQRGYDAFGQGDMETIRSIWTDEFIEDGNTVVALGHVQAKAKSSGEQVKVPFAHVWRIRDGKAERVQILEDTAVMARALGV